MNDATRAHPYGQVALVACATAKPHRWIRRLVPAVAVVFTASAFGCANGRFQLSAAEPSASNSDGSKSDGSKSDKSSDGSESDKSSDGSKSDKSSDGSKSDGSQSDGSKSDKSSDGSSDDSSNTHSETSGTVSTKGKEGSSNAVGLYILTGALILGATTLGAVLLMSGDEPAKYVAQHERGIRLALSRGEGPFVLDVADNLGLPQAALPVLANTLRKARADLEPYLLDSDGDGISKVDGQRFVEQLTRTLEHEPTLAPYVLKVRHEVERLLTPSEASASH
jgi:hypothetical protein